MCGEDHVVVGILEVRVLTNVERRVKVALCGLREVHSHVFFVGDCIDALKLWLEGLHTARVTRIPVEERLVHVTNFLFVGAFRKVAVGRLFDYDFDCVLRLIAQHIEYAVAALVCRNFGRLDPRAIYIREKVITRLDAGIHRGEVYPRPQFFRLFRNRLRRFLAASADGQ